MPKAYQRLIFHYAIALICVLIALKLGLLLQSTFGDGFPFACFIVAVLISGWSGGLGPGLLTALLGAFCLVRFVINPSGGLAIEGAESQAGIVLYIVVTVGMAVVCGLMRGAVRRAEQRTVEVERALEEKLQVERDLNRTAKQLERSDAFHRLISDLTSDFTFRISLVNQLAKLEYVSPGFHNVTGYTLEEIHSLGGWEAIVVPDELPLAKRTLEMAASGAGEMSEIRIVDNSGQVCHLRYLIQPQRNETGAVVGLVGAAQHVTQQRRLEQERQKLVEELAEKNAFIEAVLGQVPVGIVVAESGSGKLVTSNREAERITGIEYKSGVSVDEISRSNAIAGRRADGTPYESGQWPMQRALRGEIVHAEKVTITSRDESIHLSVNAGPIKDHEGRVIAAVSVFYDETERRQIEQRVLESQRFLRCSLDALASHIAVLDENGCIVEVNEAWRRFADENNLAFFAYGVGSNYLSPFENAALECGDGTLITKGIRDVMNGNLESFEFEYPCHSPDEQRWFLLRVTRFKTPGPKRIVIAHENVTKLRQALNSLRDADRRKDEFLATLAHELRNPLAPIRNAIELLKLPQCDDHNRRKLLEMVERQSSQLTRLVDDLLDVSRVMRGKIELRLEVIDLSEVIQQALETAAPLLADRCHELQLKLPNEPVQVQADAIRVSQVLSNLITNAAKYTEPGGQICVQAATENDIAVVRIADNGIGIAPDHLNGIFDLFVQVDPTTTRSQGGLGIGLTLAKNLIELHGGCITASSRGLGEGSEFTLRIPLANPEGFETTSTNGGYNHAVPHCDINQCQVLVVDDNLDAANSLAMLLKTLGHRVSVAHSGQSALDHVQQDPPDVVFLDIGMPGMDGYEVAKRLRADAKFNHVCLAALTGWGQADDRRRTADAGFDHHIVKPPDLRTLMSVLNKQTAEN